MSACTATKNLRIVLGDVKDYKKLKRFHYRGSKLGAVWKIYSLINEHPVNRRMAALIGVIVYTMPSPNVEMRNICTDNFFTGYSDRSFQMQLINRSVRCISRVIIDPRFRGLGLASRLVGETIEFEPFPLIEAMAVMGHVNPFFVKAGMNKCEMGLTALAQSLANAIEYVGIKKEYWIDAELVFNEIEKLQPDLKGYILKLFDRFMQGFGKRRYMPHCQQRTRFILSRLSFRPSYFYRLREDKFTKILEVEENGNQE